MAQARHTIGYSSGSSIIHIAFILAAILLITGAFLEEKARNEAAFPHINFDNEYLKLYDDGLAEEQAIVSAIKGMADKTVDMECIMPISKIAY